jgi:hypothetical protein
VTIVSNGLQNDTSKLRDHITASASPSQRPRALRYRCRSCCRAWRLADRAQAQRSVVLVVVVVVSNASSSVALQGRQEDGEGKVGTAERGGAPARHGWSRTRRLSACRDTGDQIPSTPRVPEPCPIVFVRLGSGGSEEACRALLSDAAKPWRAATEPGLHRKDGSGRVRDRAP